MFIPNNVLVTTNEQLITTGDIYSLSKKFGCV